MKPVGADFGHSGDPIERGWGEVGLLSRSEATPARSRAIPVAVVLGVSIAVLALAGAGSAVSPSAVPGMRAIALAAPRVVVLKAEHKLHLFDEDTLVRTYPLDLGSAATGGKFQQGDGRTPVGTFRVVAKNANSPYHRFLGLDYPGADAVEFGLARGLISQGEAADIRRALSSGGCPDWGTALGGGIGIHGSRIGRDWTAGCIALSDEHVEELFSVLRIGDTVEILP